MLMVWSVLIAGASWPPAPLREAGVLASQLVASVMVLFRQCWKRVGLPAAAWCGVAIGFVLYPGLVWLVSRAGHDLFGLSYASPRAPGAGEPAGWLAAVVLSPLFEESLYRGQLLPALRAVAGSGVALLFSSAFFAFSHLTPWSMLTTFLVGLALGCVSLVTRDLWLCVGLHAGLNLALVITGSPPQRLALSAPASLAVGLACLAALSRPGRSPHA